MTTTKTLAREITAIFGTGKSFANRETTTITAGTEVAPVGFDKDVFFFNAKEYGRWTRYAVKTEAEFRAACE